jgi:hypothetical protein
MKRFFMAGPWAKERGSKRGSMPRPIPDRLVGGLRALVGAGNMHGNGLVDGAVGQIQGRPLRRGAQESAQDQALVALVTGLEVHDRIGGATGHAAAVIARTEEHIAADRVGGLSGAGRGHTIANDEEGDFDWFGIGGVRVARTGIRIWIRIAWVRIGFGLCANVVARFTVGIGGRPRVARGCVGADLFFGASFQRRAAVETQGEKKERGDGDERDSFHRSPFPL